MKQCVLKYYSTYQHSAFFRKYPFYLKEICMIELHGLLTLPRYLQVRKEEDFALWRPEETLIVRLCVSTLQFPAFCYFILLRANTANNRAN